MTSSLDGGLHPSRYTKSPKGVVKDWSAAYEGIHDAIAADAWLVGRVTMAEMAKGAPHPPAGHGAVERPVHVARRDAKTYAVAVDRSGKLHFAKGDIGGDPVVVLLGGGVEDRHLAELAGDGVSYIVAEGPEIDLGTALAVLRREFGIGHLLLEGGGGVNGSFLAAGLVDELSLVLAPALVGRVGEETIAVFGTEGLQGKVELTLLGVETLEHDLLHLRYAVTPS
ncbi:riboflavin deaminase [Aurantimonas sp. Leaf443]|nr:riboflavin deaminase [Aurantimonas sp. Leaf443]